MQSTFQNMLWYDAVQIVMLLFLCAAVSWLATRSIDQGERIVALETNHEKHARKRFRKIYDAMKWEWQDDDQMDEE